MGGEQSVARRGGARSTNGYVAGFLTTSCPAVANVGSDDGSEGELGRIDVRDYTQVHISSETYDRRVIFQDSNSNIAANIIGSSSRLFKSGEEIILDVCGQQERYLYIATTESSNQADGIRATFYDES